MEKLKIFISYSHEDQNSVGKEIKKLKEKNDLHITHYPDFNLGKDLKNEIKNGINSSDIFLVFWSQNALQSEWVTYEIGYAEGKNKEIILVLLNGNPPKCLTEKKYIDTSKINTHETETDKLKKEVDRLCQEHINKQLQKKQSDSEKTLLGIALAGLTIAALSSNK